MEWNSLIKFNLGYNPRIKEESITVTDNLTKIFPFNFKVLTYTKNSHTNSQFHLQMLTYENVQTYIYMGHMCHCHYFRPIWKIHHIFSNKITFAFLWILERALRNDQYTSIRDLCHGHRSCPKARMYKMAFHSHQKINPAKTPYIIYISVT
jgi:hypothetical protein